MELQVHSRANGVCFISNEKIPYNLRKRIVKWATYGAVLYGPIEITAVRESEDHYSLDLILNSYVEDEMGAHNLLVMGVRFKKYKKREIKR